MDVTSRNFFRLLRAGVFGSEETLEPLSAWKWNRLYQLSVMHGVTALVYDGILHCRNQFFFQMPQSQLTKWQHAAKAVEAANQRLNIRLSELSGLFQQHRWRHMIVKGQAMSTFYANPQHRTPGDLDFFFPLEQQAEEAETWAEENGVEQEETRHNSLKYSWQGVVVEHHRQMQQLTNVLLNRTLQQIISEEISGSAPAYVVVNGSRLETVPPTLNLLLLIVRITRYLLSDGISLKQLTDLSVFLNRQHGRIEAERLMKWMERLKLRPIAQLIGALLVEILKNDGAEIPFWNPDTGSDVEKVIDELFNLRAEWRSTDEESLFAPNDNSPALIRRTRHSARYFSYYPSETLTSFLSSLARIEE